MAVSCGTAGIHARIHFGVSCEDVPALLLACLPYSELREILGRLSLRVRRKDGADGLADP